MHRDELIVLDALLTDVIDNRAFRAQLRNGHRMVAYRRPGERGGEPALRPGAWVRVRMSPFDMSVGEIILRTDQAYEG